MNGVIYARYSSHAQREESIEQQVEECQAFARQQNINIIKVYADKAISGKTDKRSAFQRLMKDCSSGEFQVVIAYKSNRIARNMLNALQYEDRLSKLGIQTLYAREEFGNTAAGRFALRMMMSVNQFYSENMAEDIKRGMLDNAEKCVAMGNLPYGYRRGSDAKYEIVPEEAAVIRDIFSAYLAGDTLESIAKRLNEEGIRTRKGNKWNKGSFHRILENERYTGVYIYKDQIRVEGGIPAIIDRAEWLKVQDFMGYKPHPKGRITSEQYGDYLLTGKLFCGHCNSPMIGMSGTSKQGMLHNYYVCKDKRTGGSCRKENVRKDLLEYRITQIAAEMALSDDVIEEFAVRTIEYQKQLLQLTEDNSLQEILLEKQKALENYFSAIEKGIFIPAMKEKMSAIQSEIDALKDEIARQEAKRSRVFSKEEIIEALKHYRNGDPKDKRYQKMIISSFVKQVFLYDDKIIIDFHSGITNDPVESTLLESSSNVETAPPYVIQANPLIVFYGDILRILIEFSEKKDLH